MTHDALFWLAATLFWTLVMSFYSTQEMAAISFPRLRLEYYVAQKRRWAMWLFELLERPAVLFSTTLFGVNAAMMASSESARRFYEALGLNPNLAPLSHIPFILLFGELIPMFAARVHAEHMCKLGIPLLYFSAKIFSPLTKLANFFFQKASFWKKSETKGKKELLSREELQKLVEEHEIGQNVDFDAEFNVIISNIFSLKNKPCRLLMKKLSEVACLETHAQIGLARKRFAEIGPTTPYLLVFHRAPQKIVGIVLPQDLARMDATDNKKISDFMRPCSFLSEETNGLEVLEKLQEEKEKSGVICVLDKSGNAQGVVTLEDVYEELFYDAEEQEEGEGKVRTFLEKTFPGDTKVSDFNAAYGLSISAEEGDGEGKGETFDVLIERVLGRNPVVGDSIFIDPVEIIVKETSFFKAKTILIRTK